MALGPLLIRILTFLPQHLIMQLHRQDQKQSQSQVLKILPQQIQFLHLLLLNQQELEQYIQKELDENPFLEETTQSEPFQSAEPQPATAEPEGPEDSGDFTDQSAWGSLDDEIPDYHSKIEQGFASDETWQSPAVQPVTAREEIKDQCRYLNLPERIGTLAEYLIDSLDDSGYLTTPLDTILDDISFAENVFYTDEEMEQALHALQSLDPAGLGARNLQECLLLQLKRLEAQEGDSALPVALVRDHMESLAAHDYENVKNMLGIDSDTLREALQLIRSLKPRPFYGVSDTASARTATITPEYVVETDGDDLVISLTGGRSGSVIISKDAEQSLRRPNTDKKAQQFVEKKWNDAQWLIGALEQRDDTMFRTMRTIATLQRNFFLTGDTRQLKPMTLRDVAAFVNLDPSTISRATSTKYIQTQFGIFPAKDLFTQTFTAKDGQELSNTDVMDALRSLVDAENKQAPFSDSELCRELEKSGFPVARRTVAKYRDLMQIPTADLRREA